MPIKVIESKEEFDNFLKENASKLVVVDFYAEWCGPCKMIAPTLDRWAGEYSDVIFVKVNVDENNETAEAQDVSAMPTFQLFKDGKKVGEVVGASETQLKEKIDKLK